MRPAVNPGEALALLKGETGVGRISGETRVAGRIRRAADFQILGGALGAGARHGQRQEWQRIGFHQQSPRRGGVVEVEAGIAAQYFIGVHGWPLVRRAGVGHQNIGL